MFRSHKSSQQSQANQQKQSLIPQCKICLYSEKAKIFKPLSDLKESFREQRGLKRGNLSEHFREQISKREQREPLIFEGHSFGRRGVGAMPCGGLFSYV